MTTAFRLPILGALLSFALSGHAQVTYTNSQPISPYAPMPAPVGTAVQTFTGFTSISSLTWTVVNTSGASQSATFNAYIGEWNSGTNTLVGSSLVALTGTGLTGTVAGSGTADLTFTASLPALNSSTTYALLLSYVTGDTTFAASRTANPGDAFFSSGGAGFRSTSFTGSGSDFATYQTNLQGVGGGISPDTNFAYSMSVTGTLAAVPEPKTAAAAFAALFVAGLFGRRVWQRRKPAASLLAA